jgi:hypothetical protein
LHLQGILPGKEYTMPEGSWIDIEKLKGHLDNELKKEYPFLQPYDTGVIVLVNEIAKIDFRIRVLLGDDSGHNLIGESRLRDIR